MELIGCGPGVGIGELDVSRPVTLRGVKVNPPTSKRRRRRRRRRSRRNKTKKEKKKENKERKKERTEHYTARSL